MDDGVASLATLLRVQFQAELSKLNEIARLEGEIRVQMAKLNGLERQARDNLVGNVALRSIGADVLWQGWLGRNRSQLNTQLAGVLVKKAQVQSSLAVAFGRKLVAEELEARQVQKTATKRAHARQEAVLRHMLLYN